MYNEEEKGCQYWLTGDAFGFTFMVERNCPNCALQDEGCPYDKEKADAYRKLNNQEMI